MRVRQLQSMKCTHHELLKAMHRISSSAVYSLGEHAANRVPSPVRRDV